MAHHKFDCAHDNPKREENASDEITLQKSEAAAAFRGFTDIAAGFILMFNAWGVANSFGLFQTYYETNLLHGEPESNIAWIGSMQTFLLLSGGVFVGPIYDAGHGRAIIAFGTFMIVFGLMMTSLCSHFWQVLLSQGLIVGIGFGCMLTPTLATMIAHFPNRANIAVGLATSGGSIGGVIYPILFHSLEPSIGFPWATRIFAFMVLGLQCLALAVIRTKPPSKKRRPVFDAAMIHNIPYSIFTLSEVFGYMGLYAPFFYIQTYAASKDVAPNLAFYTLVILNASSTAGRIVPNLYAHLLGPINMAILCTLTCSILGYTWIVVEDAPGLIIFCILYGFFSGTYVSITAPAISSTCTNPDLRGTHLGMSFGFAALGILIGNPIAGVLLGSVGWVGAQSFAASVCMLAVLLMIASRIAITGPNIRARA